MPGVFRADLEQRTPVPDVLKYIEEFPLIDIAVVGRSIDGQIHVFGSHPDQDFIIGLLERGKVCLATTQQVSVNEVTDSA